MNDFCRMFPKVEILFLGAMLVGIVIDVLNGVLALKNSLSQGIILTLSGMGGTALLVSEYYLTRGVARRAYR